MPDHEKIAKEIQETRSRLETLEAQYDEAWARHVREENLEDARLTPEQIVLITGRASGTVRNFFARPSIRKHVATVNGRTTLPYGIVKAHFFASERRGRPLSDAKRESIEMLADTSAMSPAEISKVVGIAETTVRRVLAEREAQKP